jgi:hypothetical protein
MQPIGARVLLHVAIAVDACVASTWRKGMIGYGVLRTCCPDCDVPLCRGCFMGYHRAGGSIWDGYYKKSPKVSITSLLAE